jgi:hypothetical protein
MVVEPLVRDIGRLSELRPPPPVLDALLAQGFPPSADARLDELLRDACAKFRDPAPSVRKEALERLWDSWERLKTLANAPDKKRSVSRLLDGAAPEPTMREVLEAEARALTEIGNQFQIRHFERNKTPVGAPAHVDYLFHRLAALIRLLLESHPPGTGAT